MLSYKTPTCRSGIAVLYVFISNTSSLLRCKIQPAFSSVVYSSTFLSKRAFLHSPVIPPISLLLKYLLSLSSNELSQLLFFPLSTLAPFDLADARLSSVHVTLLVCVTAAPGCRGRHRGVAVVGAMGGGAERCRAGGDGRWRVDISVGSGTEGGGRRRQGGGEGGLEEKGRR